MTNTRSFVGHRVAAVKNGSRVVMKAGNWLPGSDTPAYLENLPASYGFDPLKLGEDSASLKRFQESEVIHGRWAMLGVAGCLGAELLGQGDWYSAPLPLVQGGHATYMGAEVPFDLGTLAAVEFAAMAGAESMRGAAEAEKRIYPGGALAAAVPVKVQTGFSATDFDSFASQFGKTYSAEEYDMRKSVFEFNLKRIDWLNSLNDGATYAVNEFADMTEDEFRSSHLGLVYNASALDHAPLAAELDVSAAPDSVDWVSKGAVTPVKNQGQCGSCWSFSATGDMEGAHFLATKKLVSLSEEQFVDCDKVDHGCQGGLPSNAYDYAIKAGGVDSESSYAYRGVGGTCKFSKSNVVAKIASWEKVSTDEDQIAAYVATNGPVSIGINAGPMQMYGGGIADPWNIFCNPKKLDHGVLIVGYGEENGKKYWKIKNSWGTGWGEQGYYRVVRGKGKCGLNTMVTHSKAATE